MTLTTPVEFRARWLAHFGQAVHPIVELLLAAATRLWGKSYEDTELCWAFLNKRLTAALAFELERDESGPLWHIMLPSGIATALDSHVWQGRFSPEAPCFARELASGEDPYCVLELVFSPGGEPGISLEFFFGGKPYDAEE